MGHCGKDITCTKLVMMGLRCSPLSSSQDQGHHLQVHRECLQDCREIFQSISQHLPARLLHLKPPSGALERHPISLLMKRFKPAAELRKTYVAGIADLPPLPEMSYDECNADDESDNSSDLGGAEGKPPISLKQTEFSLKQYAKRMVQPNFSAFNKWKTVWVVGFLEKKHRSNIRGQNRLKQVWEGPLHWEMEVTNC